MKRVLVRITLVFAATFATTTLGQQTVTTAGGSANVLPLFSGSNTVVNSSLWNAPIFSNGLVGQGSNDFGEYGVWTRQC